MTITATVKQTIDHIPPGTVFGYEVFEDYPSAPEAVVQAVNRCVLEQRLQRLVKGRFYTPKKGLLGPMKVSDDEILRDALFRDGRRRGYITGPALYNRMGLTTQMPRTVTVAASRASQVKDFGTLRIKFVERRTPITEATVPLLELLDILRDAKKVPDASVSRVLDAVAKRLENLTPAQLERLQRLAIDFYNASSRALLGVILEGIGQTILPALRASINPTTRFQLELDIDSWPQARAWNIR